MTRILVVIGTPIADSLTHSLAQSYATAAREAGAQVDVIDLATDPIPAHPTSRNELRAPRTDDDRPLDPDVADYVARVANADHLALFFPQWWGTYPAALKAFVDRVFLSGFAFRYRPTGKLWDPLLTGRTARIVMTMDSPRLWNALRYRHAAEISLKNAILSYCGIRTAGITRLAEVRHVSAATRERWVDSMGGLARRDAAASRSTRERERAVSPAA
ncbi:NAD(P)H-dependent oxidoreductase [Microbacterium sp. C7(2022)]|uniref:NAD(P)H-dependent oxidoreductase n=1 Tax=Microbacterium sp. C7(2022) TaxID=2992759 RepID=UPI00237B48E4|nr:NAD(P)H-dependent oxidoreductase [Microbacterium sp. C7(2022)]MDE0547405.1 NAD(P)H-dependent oxidoreductase [Microbacterium sp. C7(2022)]